MHRWWADDDGEETDVDHPTTYLEATHHLAKPLRPSCAPRIVQSWYWGATERTLDKDLREGGGSAADRAFSLCTACLLD
jgi:hypothetical protein